MPPYPKLLAPRSKVAVLNDDELPPELGTGPIPPGTLRLYHYTREPNVESIARSGLLEQHARGDDGKGTHSDASSGVWAATELNKDMLKSRPVIEFWAPYDQI